MGGCQMEYNEKYNINYKIRNKLCIFETQRKICIYNINVLACKLYVYDIYYFPIVRFNIRKKVLCI